MFDFVAEYYPLILQGLLLTVEITLFGVFLGLVIGTLLAIGDIYGGKVVKAPKLMHGKTSLIKHDEKNIYKNIPQNFEATRYHSLIVDRESLPDCLEISAETAFSCATGR